MDSPKKASVKHIEFHLQREKAVAKELEGKCKSLQSQITQLELDKAELRREKLLLADDAKKASRLDERIHVLQRELDGRDATIALERAKVTEARGDTEEVRANAKRTIASWTAAEEQWIAEQASLAEAVETLQAKLASVEANFSSQSTLLEDARKQITAEKERFLRVDAIRNRSEDEVRVLQSQIEVMQNKFFEFEQTIYNLDRAGEKQKETIDLKDTEIRTLEERIAKHISTEETMEQMISKLNDRISAAKMVNLEERGEIEKLLCDLSESRKETDRVNGQMDILRREQNVAAQSHENLQKVAEELKEKCRQQQESIKEKNIELRKYELNCSQLQVDLKKMEAQVSDWSFRFASQESDLAGTKDELKRVLVAADECIQERSSLQDEVKSLKTALQGKDEEMVVLQSASEDKVEELRVDVENLEKEVQERQRIISEMSAELNEATGKTVFYQGRILEESDGQNRLRAKADRMLMALHEGQKELLTSKCMHEKETLFASSLQWHCELAFSCILQQQNVLNGHVVYTQRALDEEKQSNLLISKEMRTLQLSLAKSHQSVEQLHAVLSSRDEGEKIHLDELKVLKLRISEQEDEKRSMETRIDELCFQLSSDKEATQHRSEAASIQILTLESQLNNVLAVADRIMLQATESAVDALDLEFAKASTYVLCAGQVNDEQRALVYESSERSEALSKKCRELECLLRDSKASVAIENAALAEKYDTQQVTISALELKLKAILKEKELISFQLAALLKRFEEHQRTVENSTKEYERRIREEISKHTTSEQQCAKLRSGLEYELKRKCEYKAAAETARKLCEDSEQCREQETRFATEAIKRSNDEADYWIRCFEKLKLMIEDAQISGKQVPSIDAETASRLEEAVEVRKTGLLRQLDKNEHPGSSGLKRRRAESKQIL